MRGWMSTGLLLLFVCLFVSFLSVLVLLFLFVVFSCVFLFKVLSDLKTVTIDVTSDIQISYTHLYCFTSV